MGRTKGVKNKDGHKAGGARKGSGRKPKSVEDNSKKQTTSSSRPHATRLTRKSSTKPSSHDDRLANILPASFPSSTTQHDPHAPSYKMISPNTSSGRYSHVPYTSVSSTEVACSPLPLQLTSKESYHVSPANPWSADENFNIQTDSEFTNLEIGAIEQSILSYPTTNMTQSQLTVDHISTYTPISSPMCSPTLEGSYSQFEMNYWNVPRDTGVTTGGMSTSFTEANSGMPYCSPALSYSSCSPYMWSGSQMALSPPSHESPASSYSSLGSPITSSPSALQTTKSRRRPRRCAVCLTYGEDLNALACPGRGDRNRCPHSRVYDTHAVPHGDVAENFYFQPGQAPIPHEDLNIYSKYADNPTVNLCPPPAVTTIENPPRRPRHCKICTTTGRSGTTCPGRGNRALCPDFAWKRESN